MLDEQVGIEEQGHLIAVPGDAIEAVLQPPCIHKVPPASRIGAARPSGKRRSAAARTLAESWVPRHRSADGLLASELVRGRREKFGVGGPDASFHNGPVCAMLTSVQPRPQKAFSG